MLTRTSTKTLGKLAIADAAHSRAARAQSYRNTTEAIAGGQCRKHHLRPRVTK
jgi:hypothetical protein